MSARSRTLLSSCVALTCLAVAAGIRAQDAGGKKATPPDSKGPQPEAGADEKDPEDALTDAELEQRLFGTDRKVRNRAAWRAMTRPAFQKEDVWIRLLDMRFTADDEQEEAYYLAARGLARYGTKQCLPRIEELLKREVKALRKDERGEDMAAYPFQFEAGLAYQRLKGTAIYEAELAHFKGMSPDQHAAELVRLLRKGNAGYQEIRTPECPERLPCLERQWREDCAREITSLNTAGARVLGRAIADEEDAEVREILCSALHAGAFSLATDGKGLEALRTPKDPDETRALYAAALRANQPVQEAFLLAIRGVLEDPKMFRKDRHKAEHSYSVDTLDSCSEHAMLKIVVDFGMTELERDLIAYIERMQAKASERRAALESGEDLARAGAAENVLGGFGTETSLDYLVSRGMPCYAADRFRDRVAPKCLATLEREAATPWTSLFGDMTGTTRREQFLEYTLKELPRVEAALARAREGAKTAATKDQKRLAQFHLDCLENDVAKLHVIEADRRGKLEGTLGILERLADTPWADDFDDAVDNVAKLKKENCGNVDPARLDRVLERVRKALAGGNIVDSAKTRLAKLQKYLENAIRRLKNVRAGKPDEVVLDHDEPKEDEEEGDR